MSKYKPILKRVLLALAFIPVLPMIMLARIGSAYGCDNFFSACACFLALFPGKAGSYLRLAYYKGTLAGISPDVYIGFGSFFSRREAIIGRNVTIGAFCIIGNVQLGNDVLVASRVSIPSGHRQHSLRYDETNPSDELIFDRVTIGEACWIGEGAIVMADLGERCIVSAGSVIARAMPAGRVIGGNPARPLQAVQLNQVDTGERN